jgi:hypothetical protein
MGVCAEAERWGWLRQRDGVGSGREMGVTVRWVAEAERWVAVPRQRDGVGSGREMGVTVRWVAEAERLVAEAERWVAEAERWVAVLRQRDG